MVVICIFLLSSHSWLGKQSGSKLSQANPANGVDFANTNIESITWDKKRGLFGLSYGILKD